MKEEDVDDDDDDDDDDDKAEILNERVLAHGGVERSFTAS